LAAARPASAGLAAGASGAGGGRFGRMDVTGGPVQG
jgi:hypothetical protein